MVSLAGASAAYGGYQRAREADNQIGMGDINLQNAKTDQEADKYLGNAAKLFQQQMPGATPMGAPPGGPAPMGGGQPPMPPQLPQAPMPQTPPPGQSSVPMTQPQGPMQGGGYMGQPGAVPTQSFRPPQGGGAPPGQPSGPQGGQPGQPPNVEQALSASPLAGKLDLPTLTRAIVQANPGGRAEVIARALTKAMPLMTAQAQFDWKQQVMADRHERTNIAADRADISAAESDRKGRQGDVRLEQGAQRIDQQGGELASRNQRRQDQTRQGDQRIDLAGQREARMAAQGQIRQDQRWQQLEQQKAALEQRIQSAGDRGAITQWRAIVDAQHKRALELISSGRNSITGQMDPKEREVLVKEQNKFYEDQIKQMRDRSGNSTGRPPVAESGGQPGQAKDTSRVPAGGAIPGSPPAAAAPPEAAVPRQQFHNKATGETIEWDGQRWAPVSTPGKQSNLAPLDSRPGAFDTMSGQDDLRRKRQFTREPVYG